MAARILIISCYELGHQPFGVALLAGYAQREGWSVATADLSVASVSDEDMIWPNIVALSVPMQTAMRLGVSVALRIRRLNPAAHVCMFGLYAISNERYLLDNRIADSVRGGECEESIIQLVRSLVHDLDYAPSERVIRRLNFQLPARAGLPPLSSYAHLLTGEEAPRVVGYTEASRGCRHVCTHCPITPVYGGRFFVVPREVVIADCRQQIEAGAQHITFGDPDFLNGPRHAIGVARELHSIAPEVSFDFTAKIEHLRKHADLLPELAALGCVFIVSAVESLSDSVLAALEKGHSRSDVIAVLETTRRAGLALRPSLVPFTPWSTLDDYLELCGFVFEHDVVDNIDPIQMSIRLLIPPGSAVVDRFRGEPWLGSLRDDGFSYDWTHPDPRMDVLAVSVTRAVESALVAGREPEDTFFEIAQTASALAERELAAAIAKGRDRKDRRPVPRLTESWFCCAEPSAVQLRAAQVAEPTKR